MFNKKKKNHRSFNNLELLGILYGVGSIFTIVNGVIRYKKWKKGVKEALDNVKVDVNIKKVNENPETKTETKPEATDVYPDAK